MNEFSAPIIQQPRLMLVLPVGIMLGAVLAANVAWFIARSAGAPRAVGGVVAASCVLAGIALAISSSVGAQGSVRAAGSALEVDPRWRAARSVSLAGAEVERSIWRRGGVTMLLVGVIVEVDDGTTRVTIGSPDPALAAEYERLGAESTTVPPSVSIAPADFRRLDELLPAQRPAGSN